ncbi:MAG: chemotaxis protein CheW [Spirochaetaceae bacterium]|nr:chemotaxis protein CheW [Spirochaetaceae bacterium]
MEAAIQTEGMENVTFDEEQRKRVASVDFRMVTFNLAGKEYGIDIMQVKEIVKSGRVTFVPNVPPFVIGVYNLRGEIIPIIDFRIFFNLGERSREKKEVENMIILTIDDQILGVVVDEIAKVVGIQKASIQPPHPIFSDISIKYISGIVEHDDHLYVLLDVLRVFCEEAVTEDAWNSSISAQMNPFLSTLGKIGSMGSKNSGNEKASDDVPASKPVAESAVATEPVQPVASMPSMEPPAVQNQPEMPEVPDVQIPTVDLEKEVQTEKASAPAGGPGLDENFDCSDFSEALKQNLNFFASEINMSWLRRQAAEWVAEGKTISSPETATEFLEKFYSPCTGEFWTKEYADTIFALLPDVDSKQISVWNIGCGSGHEAFSLAAVLKRRYPNTRIRIYAQDSDLLKISSATSLSPSEDPKYSWMLDGAVSNVAGKPSFSEEIREMILFEYHDCFNNTSLPMLDVIFCRDLVSFLSQEKQMYLFEEFKSKIKAGGALFLGENEVLDDGSFWEDKMEGENIAFIRR